MSAFDDLLDLDSSSGTTQGADPFDPIGSGQSANQNTGNSSGDLLDFGFDAQVSADNGSSGKVSFEANTNPLYEFTNSESKMESDSTNPLYEFDNEPVQKEVKSEPSNLLYEYMQNEGTTNGHVEDGLSNGHEQEVDLLGGGDLMGGLSDNVEGGSGDLLGDSGPVENEVLAEEVVQTRSRSSSENSEPEQEKEESAQEPSEPVSEPVEDSNIETPEQESGPLDEGPKEIEKEVAPVENNVEEVVNAPEAETTTAVLDEGTSETKADTEQVEPVTSETKAGTEQEEPVAAEQPGDENQNDATEPEEGEKEEQKINTEEEQPLVDDQMDVSSRVEADEPKVLEPAVETEEAKSTEADPPAQEESTVEGSDLKEKVTPVDADEPDKGEDAKETETPESEGVETSNVIEELKPAETVEEVVTEEIEPEKAEEPLQEQVSIEAPVEGEPEVTDERDTNVEEKGEEAEETEQVVETDDQPDTLEVGDEDDVAVTKTEAVEETRNSIEEENALKVNGTSEVSENGVSEEDAVHFAEMSNVRQKFESGGRMDEEQAPRRISVKDEYDQGGEFENEPVQNPDVVKETDHPKEELPEIGTAKNMVNRFKSIQEEKAQPVVSQKRPSPPRGSEKVEYESQPAEHLPQYEGQVEAGVFESEPKGHENVVRSDEQAEDYKPEQGYAKNILNKFKEIQTESSQYKPHEKREITPDRSGKVEYVSEPRGEKIVYNETQSESGVFENVPKEEEDVVRSGDKADEILPEAGFAKSLLSKFKQMESEVGNRPPPSPKKETKEKSARQQFTHEQRGYLERYEPQTEAGEFENQPEVKADVVRSGDHAEEILPEVGAAKKTLERFKEIQKQSSSPKSAKAKEITPPREQSPGRNVAGVFESTPAERADVVRSGEAVQDDLPEQGTTRNILSRFKEIESSRSQSGSPGRKPKEFTPPPEAGVYENKPKEHLVIETKQAESGVLENTPSKSKADVAREREATPETEMPEQGMAKNLVSRWKQLESASSSAKSTSSTSPRFKEFTPPRDSRGPLSPKSPAGVTNGVHPSELPGQYQPQESSVIYENKPEKKEGVYREADTDWTDGMPAPNTTASMLQRFKSIQEQAKASEVTPEPVHRKDDSPSPQPDTEGKNIQHE